MKNKFHSNECIENSVEIDEEHVGKYNNCDKEAKNYKIICNIIIYRRIMLGILNFEYQLMWHANCQHSIDVLKVPKNIFKIFINRMLKIYLPHQFMSKF